MAPTPEHLSLKAHHQVPKLRRPSSEVRSAGAAQGMRMAAVAMSVGVGSFATPRDLPGLAHYLEHMLFMGSRKHPVENTFDSMLIAAGGQSNAYTDTEKTVYHFTTPQDSLHQMLDVFAQFFIDPLLLPEAAERELHCIESEFLLRKNLDGCLLQEIWRETSQLASPCSTFTCGSRKTLKDIPEAASVDVHAALQEFHDSYYVGTNMTFGDCGHGVY